MSTPELEAQEGRQKKTILLLAGGAVSLILPLLGVVYFRMSETQATRPPDSSVMFDRREKGEQPVSVSQAVPVVSPPSPPAPAGGSSLDFVKGGANNAYFQDKPAAVSTPAASAPAAEPRSAPPVVSKKDIKKTFVMPKLQGTKGFSSFKGAAPKKSGTQEPPSAKDGNVSDMLKNVPGGMDNPEVQQYLKSQGR
jgi:hypothetical protein